MNQDAANQLTALFYTALQINSEGKYLCFVYLSPHVNELSVTVHPADTDFFADSPRDPVYRVSSYYAQPRYSEDYSVMGNLESIGPEPAKYRTEGTAHAA